MPSNAQPLLDDLSERTAGTAPAGQLPATRDCDAPLKVVYIAGDGRSGSTLLDRLIGAYPGVFSCGELGNLVDSRNSQDEHCACKELARDCPFWGGVIAQWSAAVPGFSKAEYRILQRRYERLRSLLRPLKHLSFSSKQFARYSEYTRALFTAIARHSGAMIIVDSSKNPARALALSRISGIELHMLHLVRDVRAVAYSLRIPYRLPPIEGRKWDVKRRSHLRFAGTWAVVNYFCECVSTKIRGHSLLVRYEDYTANPDLILSKIAEMFHVPCMDYQAGAGHL